MDDFVGSPKPHAKRKLSALQRSSQARQRMRIIREEAHTLPVPTPPSIVKACNDNIMENAMFQNLNSWFPFLKCGPAKVAKTNLLKLRPY